MSTEAPSRQEIMSYFETDIVEVIKKWQVENSRVVQSDGARDVVKRFVAEVVSNLQKKLDDMEMTTSDVCYI